MAITKELGKREKRRALHQEVSRAHILDAAEEVFASKGYHEATVKEIAHLADFSVGAVYSFFEHKDDLVVQIYLRRGGGVHGRHARADDGAAAPGRAAPCAGRLPSELLPGASELQSALPAHVDRRPR